LKIEEIITLIEAIKASDFDEFAFEAQDIKMTLRRGGQPQVVEQQMHVAPIPAPQVAQPAPVPDAIPEPVREEGLIDVLAPMVGTYYQASSPGAEPFVSPGARVTSGDTLCILEAMKLMNEIEAEVEGVVVDVAVKNGELVEYGQVLMTLRPLKS